MFKQVYYHRASKAIEYMATDALVEADACWGGRLSGAIDNPREYWRLTDYVLQEIEASTTPDLARARAIMTRLRRRDLYQFVDEYIVPHAMSAALAKVTAGTLGLRPEEAAVQDFTMDYGAQAENPVDSTMFYDCTTDVPFHLASSTVSYILPVQFQERIVRVYAKRQEDVPVAAAAFAAFVRTHSC